MQISLQDISIVCPFRCSVTSSLKLKDMLFYKPSLMIQQLLHLQPSLPLLVPQPKQKSPATYSSHHGYNGHRGGGYGNSRGHNQGIGQGLRKYYIPHL